MQAYLSAGIRVSVIRPFKYRQSVGRKTRRGRDSDDVADLLVGLSLRLMTTLMDQVINQQLLKHYLLEARVPPIQRPTPWQVEVIDSSHRKRKDFKIATPQKLVQCASSTVFRP